MTQSAAKTVPSLTAWRVFVCCMAVLMVAPAAVPHAAFAQAPGLSFQSRSFITPFPQTDRYYLHVIGDGLAEGLANGLQQAFEKDNTLRIVSSARPASGLARPDRTNWAAEIDEYIRVQPMHIAVIMMGTNDVRNIRGDSGAIRWGSEGWRDAYAKEIDKLIKVLKDRSVAVYWVGLPVTADAKHSEDLNVINTIIRERSYIGNVKFIDSWNGFVDQNGGFSAYGPDITGQNQRLREADGVLFTPRGNRKLASFVEVMVRRDLNEARAERNIPLAGDEDEQNNLLSKPQTDGGGAALPAGKPPASPAGKDAAASKAPETSPSSVSPNGTPATETAPQAPTKAATTAPQQPSGAPSFRAGDAPAGETIQGDIDDGVTSLATVSPMADLNASIDAGERRLPVTERLYYRALVKGDSLKSKPDRADDFKWPRS